MGFVLNNFLHIFRKIKFHSTVISPLKFERIKWIFSWGMEIRTTTEGKHHF